MSDYEKGLLSIYIALQWLDILQLRNIITATQYEAIKRTVIHMYLPEWDVLCP